jgi:hypothetical protein
MSKHARPCKHCRRPTRAADQICDRHKVAIGKGLYAAEPKQTEVPIMATTRYEIVRSTNSRPPAVVVRGLTADVASALAASYNAAVDEFLSSYDDGCGCYGTQFREVCAACTPTAPTIDDDGETYTIRQERH